MSTTTALLRRSSAARLAAASVAALLVLTGCGSSGGDDAGSTTTTQAAGGDGTTTTAGGDDGTTTSEAGSTEGETVSPDDLEALLPEASAIGADYSLETEEDNADDGSDAASDDAIEEACPDAAPFMEDDNDDSAVSRSFETSDGRGIEVKLNPEPKNFEEDVFDSLIDAVNACESVEFSDDGFDYRAEISAERDDTYGDRGVVVSMKMTVEHAQLPQPIQIEYTGRSFLVGTVSVAVSANDGVDDDTYETVPADTDLLDQLAADLEPQVADLVGG